MRLPSWLSPITRSTAPSAWVGVQAQGNQLVAVRALPGGAGRKPRVQACQRVAAAGGVAALAPWLRCVGGKRDGLVQLLAASDYQIAQIDCPAVEPSETREAARWMIKDLIDFPLDEAAIDCAPVPSEANAKNAKLMAVISRRAVVQAALEHWRAAKLDLAVLDIPEMALRNVAVLACGGEACAFLHVGVEESHLLLLWQQELCMTRRLGLGARRLRALEAFPREGQIERLALEVQRTIDAFGRQFSAAHLTQLWVSSLFEPNTLCPGLAAQVGVGVQPFHLAEWVDFDAGCTPHDLDQGLDHTLALGVALREPATA